MAKCDLENALLLYKKVPELFMAIASNREKENKFLLPDVSSHRHASRRLARVQSDRQRRAPAQRWRAHGTGRPTYYKAVRFREGG
jgi:hypothetical protein